MKLASTPVRPAPRFSRSDAVIVAGVAVVLLANLIGLVFHGDGYNPVVDGSLPIFSDWAAVILVWLAVQRSRSCPRHVLLAAAAVTAGSPGATPAGASARSTTPG